MPSMLEVMREYKHLTARKRAEGSLPASLEQRLSELEGVVKAGVKKDGRDGDHERSQDLAPQPRPGASSDPRGALPAASAAGAPAPANNSAAARNRPPTNAGSGRSAPAAADPKKTPPPALRTPHVPSRPTEIGRAPVRLSFYQTISARLPSDPIKRFAVVVGATFIALALDVLITVLMGLPYLRSKGSLLPALALMGGGAWAIIYPGLMAWREYAAARGNDHIQEPDFEARIPNVEPWVAAMSALGIVLWVWLSGHMLEGFAYVSAVLVGLALGMTALGFGASFVVRPVYAKKVKKRALRQYLEGGTFHLNKGNSKRARRLLERAAQEAAGTSQFNEIARLLKNATLNEADEFRKKGHTQKADELVRQASQRPGMELVVGWTGQDGEAEVEVPSENTNEQLTADEILAMPPRPAVLLKLGEVTIDEGRERRAGADEAAIRERARILERKGRAREALEMLVQSKIPVTRSVAQEATKQYITQGLLRSADAIYEALRERPAPEFYQAVAAEWAKESGGDPPPEHMLRLARKLAEMNALEAAARLACRGALSKKKDAPEKKTALELALHLCKQLGMEPPVEILEAQGEYATAARAYEHEGRKDDALRCYQFVAEGLLEKKEPPAKLIPVLSKIFILDQGQNWRYLEPLAQHVLDTNAAGPSSMKILLAYRKHKRDDEKLAARMFHLFVEGHQRDEAWVELEMLSKLSTSNPELLIKDHRLFVDRFADHLKARAQYVRLLLKVGRIEDAAAQVHQFINRGGVKTEAEETIALLELLLDWGHDDNELRKTLGLLRIKGGKVAEGLPDLERYVREGGRDPEALQLARDLLSDELATGTGAPNHEKLLRLGAFELSAGDPEGCIQHLEVCRTSKEHKQQAELLLGRAYVAIGDARKALALLQKAVAGRAVGDALELHYELARAHEALGAYPESLKIDTAIAEADPDFVAEYEKHRPRADRADTAWAPESLDAANDVLASDTESGARPLMPEYIEGLPSMPSSAPSPAPAHDPAARLQVKSAPRASAFSPAASPARNPLSPEVEGLEEGDLNLGDVLLPRYRLLRKLGAGGMGEVHLAEDVDLGRYVAIKVLRRSLANDLFLLKFKEEARIVAQLMHPNIVQIYDLGQRGNYSYIVMEYVDGPDLASLINRSNGFERKRLIRIVASVADAMEYAHSKGVIHRDLKPANILVGPQDIAKVTDFGIAKVLQPDGHETAFSAAGLQVGTVNYMAPEQISGKPVDGRTDIYLLATTLYVCLTGQFPYTGDAVVYQKLKEDPAPLRTHVSNIAPDLEACVMKSLARKPETRYQRMSELADALRKTLERR